VKERQLSLGLAEISSKFDKVDADECKYKYEK